ncbi:MULTISPECIES: winged helix-turn-helix transcriptional regulator [Lysinibacillus]|uniref:Helix-turn-helix transcriptional regulator n=3 Tax=Lysinibacillus TaxID=400634 RepID=A0A4U2ZEA0_9BACI|nr:MULTISPECIES: helix-turn-helix domain-containing protein [Lysinibacillus]AHN20669.1 HxlR family transcriptional regulator [Lysinibacillus varians]TKI48648.1 helix-turn-helix transcriptional regulator [Lysinibacillus tabacifolii]TKI66977.1 helix-turn-helix transcriptional regulator [Lysinibacillus varians]TKI72739.1 helix-turn-helix transcriptional regulator [Lysinibacillus mangiferihumi]
MKTRYDLPCNIAQTLNIIGDRWTLLILHELLIGQTNFNDIKLNLPGLSANLLSARLKSLEEAGLVASTLYSAHPPRYAYSLTESGKALESVFNAMILWGSEHLDPCYKEIVDAQSGERVEIGYYSKTTGERIDTIQIRAIQNGANQ